MKVAEKVAALLKSLTGGEAKGKKEEADPDDDDLDLEDKGAEGEMEKSLVDVTGIMEALVDELKDMNKSLKDLAEKQETLEKSQADFGEAVVGVAEMVNQIANTPLPAKSAMAKGGLGAGGAPGTFPRAVQSNNAPPTEDEFERAQSALIKSCKEGEITIQKSEMISSDLQKAMRIPGYKMNPEYYNFLAGKMRTA
jgi:hypothetical protein